MEKSSSNKRLRALYTMALMIALCLIGCLGISTQEDVLLKESEMQSPSKAAHVSINSYPRQWKASVRGLHQVNDSIAWASGTGGSFMRCLDGTNWESDSITGYTHLDFRDIHAFSENEALIMAAGEEGRILRTTDGGQTWREVYTNLEEGVFLDGMDFDGDMGYCIGDPLNEYPFILGSIDRGEHWTRIEKGLLPDAIPGEGSYAASGTTIVVEGGMSYAAFGGDSLIRVLKKSKDSPRWESVEVPLRKGEGCGIFSMAFQDASKGIAVGGCYLDSLSREGNAAITYDSGKTWLAIEDGSPLGYRSAVAYSQNGGFYIACGRSGVDVSFDEGAHWTSLSSEGYFTISLGEHSGWLMGRKGRVARLTW